MQESNENKKMKRRESDAKCRANISAGFDLLKEQVYGYASGSQEKVSKEAILHQCFVRIKYLEGVLIALQQTREFSNGRREKLQEVSPLQQLRDIHHQFVALQQRKWTRPTQRQAKDTPRLSRDTSRTPKDTPRTTKDTPRTPKDRQECIRRMLKRRRPKHKPWKKSPVAFKQKKCSPIIHLPPALHIPSRPQKRIKLASTELNQDQVVPLSSILNPALKMPSLSGTKKGAGRGRAGSQTVPDSPCGKKDEEQQENLYANENGGRPSPMVDVCATPSKSGLLRGSSMISTPMKTYQIIGTSITPVKMDYPMESQEDSDGVTTPRVLLKSPDLVCDEEPTSWPEDDSSSSSGSIPELHVSHPWFSTPVRPTSLLMGTKPPVPPAKQPHPQSRPPVLEPQGGPTENDDSRRKELFSESSRERVLKENSKGKNLKCTTTRKKYRKRATAARVRAWDSSTGRVLSPVQPYSGVFKTIQQRKVEASSKSKTPAVDPDSPTGCFQQKLSASGYDAPLHPTRSIVTEGLVEQGDSDVVYVTDFAEDSDEEIIDLLALDNTETISNSADNVVPSMCLEQDHIEDSSPACLRDVSLPPPAGTISPPSLIIDSTEYDESPELFKGFKSIWLKDPKQDNYIAVDADSEVEHYPHLLDEEGFYDYQQQARCHPDDDDATMMDQEEDLFEADLGDMRHLDPALQPPSSSLDSEDYIVRFRGDELEELDNINVVSDAEERGGSCRDMQSPVASDLLTTNDILITPALASFATSALSVKHTRRADRKGQKRRRNVRLNLPNASTGSGEEEDDLNIWKFTQAALNEKDVLLFLPTDNSYALISNSY